MKLTNIESKEWVLTQMNNSHKQSVGFMVFGILLFILSALNLFTEIIIIMLLVGKIFLFYSVIFWIEKRYWCSKHNSLEILEAIRGKK